MAQPPSGLNSIHPTASTRGVLQNQEKGKEERDELDEEVQGAVRERDLPASPPPAKSKGWFGGWFGGKSDSSSEEMPDDPWQGYIEDATEETKPAEATPGIVGRILGWGVQKVAERYTKGYRNEGDKERLIAEQKEFMQNLGDQFIELYEFVTELVYEKFAKDSIPDLLRSFIPPDKVKDLVEIILARGFANLAREVLQNQNEIPNFSQQPSLVSILFLICKKASPHINAEQLAEIEFKYRDQRREFSIQTKKLFPDNWDAKKEALLHEYIQSTNEDRREEINRELFPNLMGERRNKIDEIQRFFTLCERLGERHQELNQLFRELSDDVLVLLFPHKLSDLELPPGLDRLAKIGFVQNKLYSYGIQKLADILQQSYEPLENDATRNEERKAILQSRVGDADLQLVIDAPASLLVAFTRNYIQTDPSILGLTASLLEGALKPQEAQAVPRDLTDEEKHEQLMAQLSHQELANWIVQSIQAVLHTQDPDLIGLGGFLKQALNNLSTALLSKGVQLVIPDGEVVEKDQFIKELTDRIAAQFGTLTNQVITEEYLKGFIQDLPLPPLVKDKLTPLLLGKIQKLQAEMKNKTDELTRIEEIRQESEDKIRGYDRGEELLTIIAKSTDQITEWLLAQNIGLISTLGLSDTLDEILAQYGIKINDDLKNWFKNNISALEVAEGGVSPQTTLLLKKGIQAVLSIALVNTIETSLNGDSNNYAANLLQNARQAFLTAVTDFDTEERTRLDRALEVQQEIDSRNKAIAELRSQIDKKPEGLSAEQLSLLEEMLQDNTRVVRAAGYLADLKKKREEIFKQLNEEHQEDPWSVNDLPYVNEALILTRVPREGILAELEAKDENTKDEQILIRLLKMPSDELKLVSDAVNIEVTIEHAEKEQAHLSRDLELKNQALLAKDQEELNNRAEWDNGRTWAAATILNRSEIQKLSAEVSELEIQLDTHLRMFRVLSNELMGMVGIEKDLLNLPEVLEDLVWPKIEEAKNKHIARLLFKQLTPLLLIVSDREANREKLNQLSKGSSLLSLIAATASKEILSRIPEFIASYKPFAREILVLMGIAEPTAEEIDRMEEELRLRMIGLGKEGTASSMLLPLFAGLDLEKENKEALSNALEALINSSDKYLKISVEDILPLLRNEMEPADAKQERVLQISANALARSVNSFLLQRGKGKIKPADILGAFRSQRQGDQKGIAQAQEEAVLSKLKSEKVIEKIQTVVMTPEDIGHIVNDIIPGQTDLQPLITSQVQAVIGGEEEVFKENRDFIQKFIEGFLLKIFVKIGEANEQNGHSILAVLGRKLQKAIPDIKNFKGKPEELARQMIDDVLREGFAIASESDLDGVPPALQEVAYKSIKEQAYNALTPLLLPMIESVQDRARLEELSGNKFLGSLLGPLTRDLFKILPAEAKSYITQEKIAEALPAGIDPKLIQSLAEELHGFLDPASEAYQNVTGFAGSYVQGILMKALIRIAESTPAEKGKDTLFVLTEKLLKLAGEKLLEVKSKGPEQAAKEINDEIIKLLGMDSPDFFEGLPDPLKEKAFNALKDQLGGMLITIQKSLNTLAPDNAKIKQTEVELKAFRKVETVEERKAFGLAEGASTAYAQILAEDIANMVMTAVPKTLTEIGGEKMRGVNAISKGIETYLEELARGNLELAQMLLNYVKAPQFQQLLGEKITAITAQGEFPEERAKAANLISNLLLAPLNNLLTAATKFEEEKKAKFNQNLMAKLLEVGAGHLKNLNEAKEKAKLAGRAEVLYQDFVEAANAGGGLHPAVPTKPVTFQKTLDTISERLYSQTPNNPKLEGWKKEQDTLRVVIAGLAEEEKLGKKNISMKEIVDEIEKINEKITGKKLTKVQRRSLLKRDEKGYSLRDLIRQERDANLDLRQEEAFDPAIKVIMQMIFPNGKRDLDFVPKNMRQTVWNIFENNLFPIVLPLITELLLDRDVIESMVLSGLESAKESLKGEIIPEPDVADLSGGALDRASGKLIGEALKGAKLPGWMKNLIIDPKTGEVSPAIEESLGGVLRKQFDEKFIRDKLKLALENLVKRDEKGDYLLKLDGRPKDVKKAELEPKRKKMKEDLRRLSREVVDISISYLIRSKWAQAQARFDDLVDRAFGKVGLSLKHALDAVFGFIFFKIIGTILSVLFYPVKGLAKQGIYRLISLDENRDAILEMLTHVPVDQPEGTHVGYHEDLLYKAGQKLKETIDQTLKLETVIKDSLEKPILDESSLFSLDDVPPSSPLSNIKQG